MQKTIQKAIQDIGQHPFLFVGSGFSRRYLNTPNFEDLLRNFSGHIGDNEFLFPSYLQRSDKHMPTVAGMLEDDFNREFYKVGKFVELKEKYKTQLQSGMSPFKISVADFFSSNFSFNDKYSKEIDLLRQLSIRSINGVITTNYDFLVENLFQDFQRFIGQNELLFSTLSGVAEIYKIHGCSSSPESIVITQSDYEKFNNKSQYLVSKLLTIFLEYPIFFIGYSLNDENIQLIFKNIKECLTEEKLAVLQDRLFFIKRSKDGKEEKSTSVFEGIPFTQITTNDYSKVYEGILSAKSNYNPRLISKLKRDVYSLVKTHKSKDVVGVIDIEKIDDMGKINKVVIGVGDTRHFVSLIDAKCLYKYAVLNEEIIDSDHILEIHFKNLLLGNQGGLPIFKLLSQYSKPFNDLDTDIKSYVLSHQTFNSLLSKTDIESTSKKKLSAYTIDDLISEYGEDTAYRKIMYLDEKNISIEKLESYLVKIVKEKRILEEKSPYSSYLKKSIRIYDFLKYKDKVCIPSQ